MNWRDLLRKLLALRCEESSLLASQELDDPLGASDRLAMWGHLLSCRSCRRFRYQLRWITEPYRRRGAFPGEPESEHPGLSPESRRRINEALLRAGNDGNPGGSES